MVSVWRPGRASRPGDDPEPPRPARPSPAHGELSTLRSAPESPLNRPIEPNDADQDRQRSRRTHVAEVDVGRSASAWRSYNQKSVEQSSCCPSAASRGKVLQSGEGRGASVGSKALASELVISLVIEEVRTDAGASIQ